MGITDRLKQLVQMGLAAAALIGPLSEAGPKKATAVKMTQSTKNQAQTKTNVSQKSTKEEEKKRRNTLTDKELATYMDSDEYKDRRDQIIAKWLPMAETVSEGYYPYGYKDTEGYPTIGIGTCFETATGITLDDIPIRYQKDYQDGRELTLEEKKEYVTAIRNNTRRKGESDYKAGKRLADEKKIAGITKTEALWLCVLEARPILDRIYKRAYLEKDVDLLKESFPVQILSMDISYQIGSGGLMKFKNFWKSIYKRQYTLLQKEISVNEGAAHNKERHKLKLYLAQKAASYDPEGPETQPANQLEDAQIDFIKYRVTPERVVLLKKRNRTKHPLKERTLTPEQAERWAALKKEFKIPSETPEPQTDLSDKKETPKSDQKKNTKQKTSAKKTIRSNRRSGGR
ncbi:MAG: hypothetical protein ACI4QM_04055 [Alphaproteobacteria bacterium]